MEKETINSYIQEQITKSGNTLHSLSLISSYLKLMVPGLNMDDISDLLQSNANFYQLVDSIYQRNKTQIQKGNVEYLILEETALMVIDTYCMLNDMYYGDDNINVDDIANDNVKLYIKETYQRPLLTPEQEKEYLAKIKNGDVEAKKYFLECNLRLVISYAKRYLHHGIEFLDLIQIGNLGLMRALEKYDDTKNTKFSTYAYQWIRQYINRALAENGVVKYPTHVQEKLKEYYIVTEKLKEKLKRNPTMEEIAIETEWKLETILGVYDYENRENYYGIEQNVSDDNENLTLESFLPSNELSPEDHFLKQEMKKRLKDYMLECNLTEREIRVLKLRFGLENGYIYTLEEVGKIFGVTRERIRQIENSALVKLRKPHHRSQIKEYRSMPVFKERKKENVTPVVEATYYTSTINWQMKKEEVPTLTHTTKSIYQKFIQYPKENIDIILSLLTNEELSLLKLDLGDNLDGLNTHTLTNEQRRQLNIMVIPKMIKMLKTLEQKEKIPIEVTVKNKVKILGGNNE